MNANRRELEIKTKNLTTKDTKEKPANVSPRLCVSAVKIRYTFVSFVVKKKGLDLHPGRRKSLYPTSEREFQCKLGLQRVAHALAQEAVKVEQPWRNQRVDVVFVVEAVEHLDHGREHVAVAKVNRP